MSGFEDVYSISSFLNCIQSKYGSRDSFVYKYNGEKRAVTYTEFTSEIYKMVTFFKKHGIQNKRVCLCGKNSYSWIVASFAILAANNILIPNSYNEIDTLHTIVAGCEADYLIHDGATSLPDLNCASQGCGVIEVLHAPTLLLTRLYRQIDKGVRLPETCSYIFYTSGSTGRPKGVLHSQKNVLQAAYSVSLSINMHHSTLLFLPLNHIYAYCDILILGLMSGITLFLSSGVNELLNECVEYSPGCVFTVPALLYSIYDSCFRVSDTKPEQIFGSKLKTLFVGGAALDPGYVEKYAELGIDVLNGYGMTETCGCVCLMPSQQIIKESVGKPTLNNRVKVIDGEVYLFTPSMMLGYLEEEEHGHLPIVNGWYKANDYGRYSEGYLFLEDRRRNVIVLPNGKKVSADNYTEKLSKIVGVIASAIVVKGNKLTAEILIDPRISDTDTIRKAVIAINRSFPISAKIQNITIREENGIGTDNY